MAASDIRAGKSFVEVYLKNGQLLKGLANMQQHFKALGGGLTSIGMKMMAGGSAVLASVTAMAAKFTDAGDAASKMAQRTGMTAESVSQLTGAAEFSNVAIEEVEGAFKKFQKTLGDAATGSKEATAKLTDLGLSVEDLEAMSPDDQFEALADAISKVEGPTNRANSAMDMFGKSGTTLLPMLEGGAEGLRQLKQQAVDLGLAMDGQAIQSAVEMDDAVDALKGSAVGLSRSIGSALTPMLTELAKVSTACIVSFSKFIREHGDLIRSIAKGAAAVVAGGAAAMVLGKMFSRASLAVGFLAPAILTLASPLGIVAGLVLGGAVAWMKWSDSGKKAAGQIGGTLQKVRDYFSTLFGDIGETGRTTWGAIVDAVSSGDLATAGEVAWAGLTLIWHQGTKDIQAMWASTKWYFLTVWGEATTGIAKGFYEVLGALEAAWVNTASFFKTVWNEVSTFVLSTRNSWGESIGNAIITAAEKSGAVSKEFAATWRDTLKNQTAENQKGLQESSRSFQSEIDANQKSRNSEIEARTKGIQSILDDDKKRAQGQIDDDYEKSISEKQKALDDARARLAELKKKTDAMAGAAKGAALGGDDAGEELQRRGSVVSGSFFAAALTGIGGANVQEKIAKTGEKQLTVQQQQLAALVNLQTLLAGLQIRVTS